MVRVVLECVSEKTDKFMKVDIDSDEIYLFKNTAGKYIFKLWNLYYIVKRAYYAKNVDWKFVHISDFDMDSCVPKRASQESISRLWWRKAYSTIAKASPRLVGNFILNNNHHVS